MDNTHIGLRSALPFKPFVGLEEGEIVEIERKLSFPLRFQYPMLDNVKYLYNNMPLVSQV